MRNTWTHFYLFLFYTTSKPLSLSELLSTHVNNWYWPIHFISCWSSLSIVTLLKSMSRSHHDRDDCVSTSMVCTSKRCSPASEKSCQHAQLTSLVAENWVWSLSRIWHNETSTGTTLKSTFTQSTARSGACWTCHSQCSQTLGCTATLSQWKGTRWWATLGISQCYVKCFFS